MERKPERRIRQHSDAGNVLQGGRLQDYKR